MTASDFAPTKRALSPSAADAPYYPLAGPAPKKARKVKLAEGEEPQPEPEKRQAIFKKSLPNSIAERVDRVMSQRFFCVDRTRTSEITEDFKVLGSTGNVYNISIKHLPTCSCPDGAKGNCCKHILFVLLKVLHIPQTSNLYYQKALLTSELQAIFAHAPRDQRDVATERLRSLYRVATGQEEAELPEASGSGSGGVQKRLPGEGDSCPVCYEDFTVGQEVGLVFCLSIKGCGNGLHEECFANWAKTTQPVTCVFCRADWTAAVPQVSAGPSYSAEGYLNLASQAGISRYRDTSSYYRGPQRGKRWDGGFGRYGEYGEF